MQLDFFNFVVCLFLPKYILPVKVTFFCLQSAFSSHPSSSTELSAIIASAYISSARYFMSICHLTHLCTALSAAFSAAAFFSAALVSADGAGISSEHDGSGTLWLLLYLLEDLFFG